MQKIIFIIITILFGFSQDIFALDADDLDELLGYTMVAHSNVKGDFEGADFDKLVALDNGMIFEFTEYSYSYSYRPAVAVFARIITPEEMQKLGIKQVPAKSVTLYKLVIDDDIYDARRLR